MSEKSQAKEKEIRREWVKQKTLEEIIKFSETIKLLKIIIPKKEDCETIFEFHFLFDESAVMTIKAKEVKDPKNFGLKYFTLFSNVVPESLQSYKNFSLLLTQLSDDNKIKKIIEKNTDEVDYVAIGFCDFLLKLEITQVREKFVLSKHIALDFKNKKQVYIQIDDIKNFLDNSDSKIGRDLLSKIIGDVKIKEARLSIGGRANTSNPRVWLVDLDKAEEFSKKNMEQEEFVSESELKGVFEGE